MFDGPVPTEASPSQPKEKKKRVAKAKPEGSEEKSEYANGQKTRTRAWFLTINNYGADDFTSFTKLYQAGIIRYYMFQEEIGGKAGVLHIQAVVYFNDAKSMTSVKELFPRAHLEEVHHWEDAVAYCSKLETRIPGTLPESEGKCPKQGGRTDWDKFIEDVRGSEKTLEEIAYESASLVGRYTRGCQFIMNWRFKPRTAKPVVYWFWGPTGSGKTKKAVQVGLEKGSYYIKNSTKWWDGYEQQKVVIMDEYSYSNYYAREEQMKTLTDMNQMLVETKGGMVNFSSPIIIFTSDSQPESFVTDDNEVAEGFTTTKKPWNMKQWLQIQRRITHICEFKYEETTVIAHPVRQVGTEGIQF